MNQRMQSILEDLGIYGLWVALAALAALAAYELYGALLYIGLRVVDNPDLRPPGWNTSTIHGLSRFLVLVLGICWLFGVSFVIGYLKEAVGQHRLWIRVMWLVLLTGAIYGISYGVLFLLSR